MSDDKLRPRRRKVTLQDIADRRYALDLAADHCEAGQLICDKAGRALDRIAAALFGKATQ
jgi:hypothetical protein